MADQSISQLEQLNGAALAAGDLLPIVDTSASQTKKIRAADLIQNGIALTASGNINLDKLDQTSAVKLGTSAIASGAITSEKLAAGAVDTNALASGVVTNEKIADATITYAKLGLADNSVPGSKIQNATISGLQIAAGGIPTASLADGAVTNTKIAASGIEAGRLAAGAVTTSAVADDAITQDKLANASVGTDQLIDDGTTAAKLANNSSSIVSAGSPVGDGAFVGQQWFDDATKIEYTWDGTTWERQAAINTITFTDSTPVAFTVSYPDNFSAEITTTLDNQEANRFFAGPSTGAATTPTFRAIESADLPAATDGAIGGMRPGTGLDVDANGIVNHSNTAIAGTYAGPITIDAEGHITSALASLQASDIPDLDASKITSGQFEKERLAPNSVGAEQLDDYGIAIVSETAPIPEFAGQWWVNPADRSAYIWVGEVSPSLNGYWLNLGYGSPSQINLRFGGTYNASGNTIESINSYGIEAGLTIGSGLATPNTSNNGVYLIVTTAGSGVTPAPATSLAVGNWILSQGVGTNWTKVDLGFVGETINDNDVLVNGTGFTPSVSGVANQEEMNTALWNRVQIATTTAAGIVRASSTIAVASGTGEMSVVEVDEGTY